jgi:hypothetical protein
VAFNRSDAFFGKALPRAEFAECFGIPQCLAILAEMVDK